MLAHQYLWGLLISLVCVAGIGCGGGSGYQVSGKVTFKGQPVPKGYITFAPDASKGNKGPGGMAMIENGVYRTEPGKGVVGGPYQIRIVGMDGKPTKMSGEELLDGKPLFPPYETTLDLPTKNLEHDFEIPVK